MFFALQEGQEEFFKKDLGLQTIIGIIEPCSHDQQKVALVEEGSLKEYCILPKGAGADLTDCISEHMELSGFITEFYNNEEDVYFTIQVRSYKHNE